MPTAATIAPAMACRFGEKRACLTLVSASSAGSGPAAALTLLSLLSTELSLSTVLSLSVSSRTSVYFFFFGREREDVFFGGRSLIAHRAGSAWNGRAGSA